MHAFKAEEEPNFELYFEHALTPSEDELEQISATNEHLPRIIIDSHVHLNPPEAFDFSNLPDYSRNRMGTTFPYTTFEQSEAIDTLLFPGRTVRKVVFSHAFAGLNHRLANEYLKDQVTEKDRVALFGLSDSEDGVSYTISELESGKYAGLKMYYAAQVPPKERLYDYFPEAVLAAAERAETPIILHMARGIVGSEHEVEQACRDFPDLKIVLAHVGVAFVYTEAFEQSLARVAGLPSVYVDTSGVTDMRVFSAALKNLGFARVLYGSDEPLNLLREATYVHPTLGPRLLTDFPYHWVDSDEQSEFRHLGPELMTYNHIQSLQALLAAIGAVAGKSGSSDEIIQQVFHDNAKRVFGF